MKKLKIPRKKKPEDFSSLPYYTYWRTGRNDIVWTHDVDPEVPPLSTKADEEYPHFATLDTGSVVFNSRVRRIVATALISLGVPISNLKLVLSKSRSSATNDKMVRVAIESFFNTKEHLDIPNALEVTLGCAYHEGLHHVYTPLQEFSRLSNERGNFFSALLNLIEDERIEMLANEEFSFVTHYIGKVKYYYNVYSREASTLTAPNPADFGAVADGDGNPVWVGPSDKDRYERAGKAYVRNKLISDFFSHLYTLVRFPDFVKTEADLRYYEKWNTLFSRISSECLRPYPNTWEKVVAAAENILLVIAEEHPELFEAILEGKKEAEKNAEELHAMREFFRQLLKTMGAREVSTEDDATAPDSGLIVVMEYDEYGDLEYDSEESEDDVDTPITIEDALRSSGDLTASKSKADIFWHTSGITPTLAQYAALKSEIASYVSALRRWINLRFFYEKPYKTRGCTSGRIDVSRAAHLLMGKMTVFSRAIETTRPEKPPFVVILDLSGSMRGEKIDKTLRVACLLNEALGPDYPLYIFGHTADYTSGSTDLFAFRLGAVSSKKGMACIPSRPPRLYENRDGVALEAIMARVATITPLTGVVTLISDGCPSAVNYRGSQALDHTLNVVRQVERSGWKVIQISIDSATPRGFTHSVDFSDMSTFIPNMGLLLKKQLK